MRKAIDQQMLLGEIDVSQVKIDTKSRDDIPQVLLGLQYIYSDVQVREKIFSIIEEHVASSRDMTNGRPGMHLWKILVLGVLRLTINCDYDRLVELANNHTTLRQMLGHGTFNKSEYNLQTVKDNVKLLDEKMLSEINRVIVEAGHKLYKKKANQ